MRRLALLTVVGAALAVALAGTPSSALANGCPLRITQGTAGTAVDPIRVTTVDDLTTVMTSASCYRSNYVFRQTGDIDLTGVAWTPGGAAGFGFNGTYDGAGHAIRGLGVAVAGRAGLFSTLESATVRDLTLISPSVTSTGDDAGALAAFDYGSTISGITVTSATVTGSTAAGGIIGSGAEGTYSDLSVTGTVRTDAVYGKSGGAIGFICGDITIARVRAGADATSIAATGRAGGAIGMIGYCVGSRRGTRPSLRAPAPVLTITDVHATGRVSAGFLAGGFAAGIQYGTIARASATGSVSGATKAGGFAGEIDATTVTDAYALGAVTGADLAGGFAVTQTQTTLTNVYAAGGVAGRSGAGGLVQGTAPLSLYPNVAVASFWDTQSTGQTSSFVGTGKTTAELRAIGTFSDAGWTIAAGWSSAAGRVWGICPVVNGGRPFLVSQYTASPCPTPPSAPLSVKVTPGNRQLTVSWTTPSSDGGAPITTYTATATLQGKAGKAAPTCEATAPATRCTITGLRNGRAYKVSVSASNEAGVGVATVAASTVTPRRGLAVLSTRRSGRTVVTRVRVYSAGALAQTGRRAGTGALACRTSVRVKRAGVLVLRCALNPKAVAGLSAGPLHLIVATRFTPKGQAAVTATRRISFPRVVEPRPVTG